jgi:general L-amino acid transport system permease protein
VTRALSSEPSSPIVYVREIASDTLPPPPFARGTRAWVRENLFSGIPSSILTILSIAFIVWIAPGLVRYFIIDAVWSAKDGAACRAPGTGACWAFVRENWDYFMYTAYPVDQRWRVDVTLAIGTVLVAWLLWPRLPKKGVAGLLFFIVYPIVGFVLLVGSPLLGLPVVDTSLWGGVFVTLLVATVGIVFSLPAGVLLALGRRSRMPVVKFLSVVFIEFVRGVPFITVLFMANTMLPLFVPDYLAPDRLLRPLIGVSLFSAAYMAEEVRGGLQAMPKGQYEGAMALGLGYWRMMRLIILPQALTLVIPGIVNNFIGLFKDTTLVAIVGIFEFLHAVEIRERDPAWSSPSVITTGYIFAALFFFVFCFAMSRYSIAMERKLAAGRKR